LEKLGQKSRQKKHALDSHVASVVEIWELGQVPDGCFGSVVVAEIGCICTLYHWSCQDRFLLIPMLSMILIRPQMGLFQPRLPDHWPWKGSLESKIVQEIQPRGNLI
jgi:hypothetical protein